MLDCIFSVFSIWLLFIEIPDSKTLHVLTRSNQRFLRKNTITEVDNNALLQYIEILAVKTKPPLRVWVFRHLIYQIPSVKFKSLHN